MKTSGSHHGAILFRLSIMVTIIAILIVVFLDYVGKVEKNTERAAITRTKGLIESSLTIVFATYAVEARLGELSDLDGANPFEILRDYQLLPGTYGGEIETGATAELAPGWYYQGNSGQVVYLPRYLEEQFVFRLSLRYDDHDQSGRYDPGVDDFSGLYFTRIDLADEP